MKAPISYYGGKTRLAPWIASLFPPHDVYIEPFCGSAAVLFAKTPATTELINDVDGELVHFFRVLRDRTDDLIRVCRWTPYARDELVAAQQPSDDPLERARRYWVRSTQAFGGRVQRTRSWSVSMNGADANQARGKVARMESVAKRLLGVAIENGDAIDMIRKFGYRSDAVIYADPPYLFDARRQQAEGKRNGYENEFGTEDDHRTLARSLRETASTVFLSGYPSSLYDELYADWFRVERTVRLSMANRLSQTGGVAVEVVWSNRPIVEQPRLLDAVG